MARQCRTRATAPKVFVRTRRCATSRRYSNVCRFGVDRVGLRVVHPADHDDGLGEQLHRLPLALRWSEGAADGDGAAGGQAQDLVLVVGERCGGHDLEGVEAGPVVKVQEGEPGLRVAGCESSPGPSRARRPPSGPRGYRRFGLPAAWGRPQPTVLAGSGGSSGPAAAGEPHSW